MKNDNYISSEIKSGFLVVISLVTLIALIFMTGNGHFMSKGKTAHILYGYISGMKKNVPVHYAGLEVGEVTNIQFLPEDLGKVRVTITVAENVPLKKDSQAFIEVMGFMGETFIELKAGTPDSPALETGGMITGTDPIPLMELVKKGTELLNEFETISSEIKALMGDLGTMVDENHDEVNQIVDNLDSMTGNFNEMSRDLKFHPWKLLRKGKEHKLDTPENEKEKESQPRKKFLRVL